MSKIDGLYWKLCAIFCLSAILVAAPELSFASDKEADDIIGCTLNRIVEKMTGGIGKGIATLAVIFLGIGLFFGKLSWGLAIAIAIGIGGIFGANQIVNWVSGTEVDASKCNDTTSTTPSIK